MSLVCLLLNMCQGHFTPALKNSETSDITKLWAWTYCGEVTNSSCNLSCQSESSVCVKLRIWWLKYWMFVAITWHADFIKVIAQHLVFNAHLSCWDVYFFGFNAPSFRPQLQPYEVVQTTKCSSWKSPEEVKPCDSTTIHALSLWRSLMQHLLRMSVFIHSEL